MISLTMNDKVIEVEEGLSVLKVAEGAGIQIPTLCSHKALTPYGVCRLCVGAYPQVKIAGIDHGDRRIGIAVSDIGEGFAFGVMVVTKDPSAIGVKQVAAEIRKLDVKEVVIGLPIGMAGKENVKTQQIRAFAAKLEKSLQLPVILWDERLTTVMGNRLMHEAGVNRKNRKKKVDMYAAELILQSYLDSRKSGNGAV